MSTIKSFGKVLALLSLFTICFSAHAQTATPWFCSLQVGGNMAFGDDSYNVFSDFGDANGLALGVNLGKFINPLVGVGVKARYMNMHSRTNLDLYDAYHQQYPALFPNKGFYGYNAVDFQAMIWLRLLRTSRWNGSLLAGAGVVSASGYSKHVHQWTHEAGKLPGGWFDIDTRSRVMPTGTIGGMIEYKATEKVGINFEITCSFTGDRLEGVKYEENYDAYVAYTLGLSIYF